MSSNPLTYTKSSSSEAREQTHAENVAHYRACVERVTAMHTDIKSCPALLYMLDQIKTGQISSEYIRELDGVDMSNAAAVDEWLGDKTLKEIPFCLVFSVSCATAWKIKRWQRCAASIESSFLRMSWNFQAAKHMVKNWVNYLFKAIKCRNSVKKPIW